MACLTYFCEIWGSGEYFIASFTIHLCYYRACPVHIVDQLLMLNAIYTTLYNYPLTLAAHY